MMSSSLPKFARLNEDSDVDDDEEEIGILISSLQQHAGQTTHTTPSRTTTTIASSPKRASPNRSSRAVRKRMLQSVACVSGSPKRLPLQDHDSSDEEDDDVNEEKGSFHSGNDDRNTKYALSPMSRTHIDRSSLRNGMNVEPDETTMTTMAGTTDVLTLPTTSSEAAAATAEAFSVQRQFQVDQAIHSAIRQASSSYYTAARHDYDDDDDDKESPRAVWKMQPTYDDAHVVFQSPSSEENGKTSRNLSKESTSNSSSNYGTNDLDGTLQVDKHEPLPAQPVREDNGDEIVPTIPPPLQRATVDASYQDVEALIARVKRLDAIVKAGENEEAAAQSDSVVEATSGIKKDSDNSSTIAAELDADSGKSDSGDTGDQEATMETTVQSSTQEKSPGNDEAAESSPGIKPIPSSRYDSPSRLRSNNPLRGSDVIDGECATTGIPSLEVVASPSRQATDDGAQYFQVLYRRGDGEIEERIPVKTSVATSSIVTMSSFGIPPVPRKPLPTIRPPVRVSRSSQNVTSHAFFWRTHPKEIFTSYRQPNRRKSTLAPLNDEGMAVILPPPGAFDRKFTPNSSVRSRSSMMKTVEEVAERKFETRREHTHSSTVSSPVGNNGIHSSVLHNGVADFSPYGDHAHLDRSSSEPTPSSPSTSSVRSWVAFSEFSVGSVDAFR